ncbi:hypothetical protein N7490_011657 [Penicillium lividum]|nr:hypothetical protein N7490_011657 [Penicillium lividum]
MTSALSHLGSLDPAELAHIPAGTPPAGQESNLVDPKSEGYLFLAVGSLVMGIMYITVGISLYVKIKIRKRMAPDDWTRLISTTAYFSNWQTALVWPVVKTTFFLIYLDMFRTVLWQRYAIYFGLFVNWAFYISVFVANVYYISPAPGQSWQASFVSTRYNESLHVSIPMAVGSLILDIYLLLLPMAPIWNLQLKMSKKLGVMAVFATGLVACVASSLSIFLKIVLNSHESDFSYYTLMVFIMAIVEMCVGITASSMPSMALFFRHHGPHITRFFSRLTSSSATSYHRRSNTPDGHSLKMQVSDRWPLKNVVPSNKNRYNGVKELEDDESDGGDSGAIGNYPHVETRSPEAQFKNGTFQLIRANGNIVILPLSALEELSQLPTTLASPTGALEHDLVGEYSGVNVISQSRIHHTIVQRKLTPRPPLLMPALQDELEIAIADTFPASSLNQSEDWTDIKPFHFMGQLVARLSARALVGSEFCRDPVWLDISLSFTECLIVLRTFPTWTYSVLSRCLPSYWYGRGYLRKAQAVLGPAIQKLLKRHDEGTFTAQPTDSVMAWMIEGAKGVDRDAEMLTRSEVLLSLASVHTILIRLTNTLYDLATHPTYIGELRIEIQDQKETWTTDPMAAYSNIHKLDSVLRESQRLAPGTTLGLERLLRESHRFTSISPPVTIKKGTIVALPVMAIENVPAYIEEPGRYDPLRTYRGGMKDGTTSQWANQYR